MYYLRHKYETDGDCGREDDEQWRDHVRTLELVVSDQESDRCRHKAHQHHVIHGHADVSRSTEWPNYLQKDVYGVTGLLG